MTTKLLFHSRYILVALLMALAGSQAFAAPPPGGQLNFTILRNGSEVGSHEMLFRRTPDDLQIDIATKVLVKVAFIPVYRFEHEGHEVWHGDRLTRLWSKTNDDGTSHALNVTAAGPALAVLADGNPVVDRPLRIPASLWHEGILRQSAILNTLDGSSMAIAVSDLGSENIPVAGRPVPARHYAITGDLQRELWYDEHNVLVKVRFKAKDGSDIEYIRR